MKPIKDDNFKSSFMELYINKYSFWEEMINIKNIQNHPYFLKILFWCRNFLIKPTNLIFSTCTSGIVILGFNFKSIFCITGQGKPFFQTFVELVRVSILSPNIDLILPKVFLNTSWMFTIHMFTLERWNRLH